MRSESKWLVPVQHWAKFKINANLQLKPANVRLEVGAGPLMLEVMAVMEAPVRIAEVELDVVEVAVELVDPDVVSP